MTHTYHLSGMTCSSCEAQVKSKLLIINDITNVVVSKEKSSVTISMDKHINLSHLQQALGGDTSKYQISSATHNETIEQTKSWLSTYKPILLLFAYITGISIMAAGFVNFDTMKFMQVFMAGFFLCFSFFKLLDIHAFANSYTMYDIVASKFKAWAYIYVFIELGLGVAYASGIHSNSLNWVTLVVMSISLIGVVKSVLSKKSIQCACLGAVFNLPMSTVTIVEDLLMIVMSLAMIIL